MSEQLLCTILHVSDVHFGNIDPDPAADGALLDADAQAWWRVNPLFDGYLGHSHDALAMLQRLWFDELKTDGQNPLLLVTGDFTATGHASQFAMATSYFESSITVTPGDYLGLNEAGTIQRSIPGNHDHWPGNARILGPPTPALRACFPTPPLFSVNLGGLWPRLDFAGLHTDADVGDRSLSRLLARGRFATAIENLARSWSKPDPNAVRVLLMHHSPCHRGFVLGINRDSRRAFSQLVDTAQISTVLTGHKHEPRGHITARAHGGAVWSVLEARCGSTTQRDTPPREWSKNRTVTEAERARFKPNTALVHRVVALQGRLEWRSNVYLRTEQGFVDRGSLYRPAGVKVWPR